MVLFSDGGGGVGGSVAGALLDFWSICRKFYIYFWYLANTYRMIIVMMSWLLFFFVLFFYCCWTLVLLLSAKFSFFLALFWYLFNRFTLCFMPLSLYLYLLFLCVFFSLSFSLLFVHCVFYYDYIKKKICVSVVVALPHTHIHYGNDVGL